MVAVTGCGDDGSPTDSGTVTDSSPGDTGTADANPSDSGTADVGVDTGTPDSAVAPPYGAPPEDGG